jgi:spore maturation protein CgeB
MLLHQHVDGLDDLLDLKAGVHYISWHDSAELLALIDYWSAKRNDRTRRKIAAAGMKAVREHHSFDARVKELLTEILPKVERAKQHG